MTFVDDVRTIFDATDFCKSIRAANSDPGSSNPSAPRDVEAISPAIATLEAFTTHALDSDPPDVVASYLDFSPAADEIFSCLRFTTSAPLLTQAALNSLIAIATYATAASESSTASGAITARAILKDIVKSRASLIFDVFANDHQQCAKRALILFEHVARSHSLLASELVNRFDLSSEHFALTLCTVDNNYCRIPFLNLIATIVSNSDIDLLSYLSGKGRTIILTCANVIATQLRRELDHAQLLNRPASLQPKNKKPFKVRQFKIKPAHVQQRELHAASSFLQRVGKKLCSISSLKIQRLMFAPPLPTYIALIASAEVPPYSVAPRQIEEFHRGIRLIANRLFSVISTEKSILKMSQVATALSNTRAVNGDISAIDFMKYIVALQPKVSKSLMESGQLVSIPPQLSSRWLGIVSIIAECIPRLPCAIHTFHEKRLFDLTLKHIDPLVRHIGGLLTLSFCKIVLKDAKAMGEAHQILPSFKSVHYYTKAAKPTDAVANKLLAAYQQIFGYDEEEVDKDVMHVSLEASGGSFLAAEDAIRAAMQLSSKQTLPKILRNGYFSAMLLQAVQLDGSVESARLWHLASYIIKQADLFPQGTLWEVDIYLGVLSTIPADDIESCVKGFEQIFAAATRSPYRLFDELHNVTSTVPNSRPRASALTASAVLQLRKLCAGKKNGTVEVDSDHVLRLFLTNVLLNLVACDEIVCGHVASSSYLVRTLPSLLEKSQLWWKGDERASDEDYTRPEASNFVKPLFDKTMKYPQTPYLSVVRFASSFRTWLVSENGPQESLWSVGSYLGLLWRSIVDESITQRPFDLKSDAGVALYNGVKKSNLFERNGCVGLMLEPHKLFPPESSVADGLLLLQNSLLRGDYILVICIILRLSKYENARGAAFSAVISELQSNPEKEVGEDIVSFLQDSLLIFVERVSVLRPEEIKQIILYTSETVCSAIWISKKNENVVALCCRILAKIVSHPQLEVAVHGRFYLSSTPITKFPSVLSLSAGDAEALLCLLRYSPGIRNMIRSQLLSWSASEFSSCSPHILPLLVESLRSKVIDDATMEESLNKETFCRSLIQATHRSSKEWLNQGGYLVFRDNETIINAMRQLRDWASLDDATIRNFLQRWNRKSDGGEEISVATFMWIILAEMSESWCGVGVKFEMFSSIDDLYSTMMYFMAAFHDEDNFRHDDDVLRLKLVVFQNLLLHLKQMTFAGEKYGELYPKYCRQLRTFFLDVLRIIGEWISKDRRNREAKVYKRRTYITDSETFDVLLRCLTVVDPNILEGKDTKSALTSLGKNGWDFMRRRAEDSRRVSTATNQENQRILATPCSKNAVRDIAHVVCDLITQSIPFLSEVYESSSLPYSLFSAQEIFFSEAVGFDASRSERDAKIRICVGAISDYFQRTNAVKRFSLPRIEKNFFQESAAKVLSRFDGRRLESARNDIFLWSQNERNVVKLSSNVSTSMDVKHSTNSEFVLRTFFAASCEALETPETLTMDIGKVVKEGVLAVAITALSAPHEKARALGYACVQKFCDVIGPIGRLPRNYAAGLYRQRKQLAFLLQLLRNSISEPLTQILPLFASWFIESMHVALEPTHDANSTVVWFFLRSAVVDVFNCVGIFHLLNCEGLASEVKAARMLALDILKGGVHTARDALILRKQKVLSAVFSLAGPSNGLDAAVRMHALDTLKCFIRRDVNVEMVNDFVQKFGVIGWLACESVHNGEPSHTEVVRKISILQSLADWAAMDGRVNIAMRLAVALGSLVDQALHSSEKIGDTEMLNMFDAVVNCGVTIAKVVPHNVSLFYINFGDLYKKLIGKGLTVMMNMRDVIRMIVRQRVAKVSDEVLKCVLQFRIDEMESGNVDEWDRDSFDEFLIMDAFIARCCVQRLDMVLSREQIAVKDRDLYMLICKGMQRCATIWLTIASLCLLTSLKRVSADVVELSSKVPAAPPSPVSCNTDASFNGVVFDMRDLLIRDLLGVLEEGVLDNG